MALAPARKRLVNLMRATLADQAANHTWTYHAVRPSYVPGSWKPLQPVTGDCSKGCQFLARWAAAPDPMRNGWGPYGNSSTIWLTLEHAVHAADLQPGDIVVFGPYGRDHAAMVLEPGGDPLLWSFGHQGAPNTYRLSQDTRAKTFCLLPIADPPPTPQDKLRARTGFYAWVAWRLGEGPWRQYGKQNASVRPDVPRVIPAAWWRDLARFLLARKKPNGKTTAL